MEESQQMLPGLNSTFSASGISCKSANGFDMSLNFILSTSDSSSVVLRRVMVGPC